MLITRTERGSIQWEQVPNTETQVDPGISSRRIKLGEGMSIY